jgi:predicted transposase YbfD/YdcC
LEIRKIWRSTEVNDYVNFPYYLITSLSKDDADGKRLLNLIRGHWGIENKSHYVRDFTFDEDRSKVRTKSGPRIMATLRNFAISILRLIGYSNIAKALRDMMAKPHVALRLIGI